MPDRGDAQRWYYKMGRRVWIHEVGRFLFGDERTAEGPTLEGFWGAPQADEEESMVVLRRSASGGAVTPPRAP